MITPTYERSSVPKHKIIYTISIHRLPDEKRSKLMEELAHLPQNTSAGVPHLDNTRGMIFVTFFASSDTDQAYGLVNKALEKIGVTEGQLDS